MTDEELRRSIEAVLLVAVEPLTAGLLAELLEEPVDRIEVACDYLSADYLAEGRGFVLVRIAGGYRYQTHPDQAAYVERFANRDVSHRLSTAALETLAIVAYRQPVSRAQISALRGVNVEGVVRLLEQRGYIATVGRAEGPGQPLLYGTTDLFLERLGLDSVDRLPPVEDFLPGPDVARELEGRLRPQRLVPPSVPDPVDSESGIDGEDPDESHDSNRGGPIDGDEDDGPEDDGDENDGIGSQVAGTDLDDDGLDDDGLDDDGLDDELYDELDGSSESSDLLQGSGTDDG